MSESYTDDAAHHSPFLIVFVFLIILFVRVFSRLNSTLFTYSYADFGCCSTSHSMTLS
jgi:hypothetical protein